MKLHVILSVNVPLMQVPSPSNITSEEIELASVIKYDT